MLHPRTKGFCITIETFRQSHVRVLYDLTLAYRHRQRGFGAAPSMSTVLGQDLRNDYDFHVHIRRFELSELPEDPTALEQWLRDRFYEKDRMMAQMAHQWTADMVILSEPVQ